MVKENLPTRLLRVNRQEGAIDCILLVGTLAKADINDIGVYLIR